MASAAAPFNPPDFELPEMQLHCDLPTAQLNTQLPTPSTTSIGSNSFIPQDLTVDMTMDMDMNMLQNLDYGLDPEISEVVRADL